MGIPVEIAAVHDGAAYRHSMSVHVLGRGMSDYVSSPFERPAMNRSGKGVVNDKGDAMVVSYPGKLFYVKNFHTGIGDCLTEQELGLGAEGGTDLLFRSSLVYESNVYSKFLQGSPKKVESSAVDVSGCHDMSSCLADVDAGEKVRRLAG